MRNAEISNIFRNMANLLEIKGENPFRIRAYRKAADSIDATFRDLSTLSSEELLKIPGIGKDLSGKIKEYLAKGSIAAYEELKLEVPESLVRLFDVPGLGPKTISLLYNKYKIRDIDQLEEFARSHKLTSVPGIKDKTEQNIIKGIEMLKRYSSRYPIGKILPVANEMMAYLKDNSPVKKLSLAGSLRRWRETVKDIDIIATAADHAAVMKAFTQMPDVTRILVKGPTKSSVLLNGEIQVDIRVVAEESYGSAMAYFTGSAAHNVRLREIASKAGLKINEYGIFMEKGSKKIGGKKEEDIYNVLGLQFVPPELREDTGEIEAAASGSLPDLITPADIRGDLHLHSNWSDGTEELIKLASTAAGRGYEYIAITDHSKGLGVARGLNVERVLQQKRKIDAINKRLKGLRLLSGIEVNIKSDGSLDLDNSVLSQLDVVVASIHTGFRQSGEKLTQRIVAAMGNPYVSVIAHPTGRLIGEREPYELDIERMLETASETGTAIEINAYPMRLDLADSYVRAAKNRRVRMVINSDAHNSSQLEYISYGVSVARRGWLEKNDVLNSHGIKKLMNILKNKTKRI